MPDLIYPDGTIFLGECREKMALIPDKSIHCVVTSPPYYALRRYSGLPDSGWGGDPDCPHEWTEHRDDKERPKRERPELPNAPASWGTRDATVTIGGGSRCVRCGAWRGQLGNEPNVAMFIDHLVEVFRSVWRILRDDGVCFVNLGDSYAGSNGNGYKQTLHSVNHTTGGDENIDLRRLIGRVDSVKAKSLFMVPERFGIAMEDDGWYVRSRIIWHKKSSMPESTDDRPTASHETVWLLTKNPDYYYDRMAVRQANDDGGANIRNVWLGIEDDDIDDIWSLGPEPFSGAHFATYPTELVRRCILLATSEKGCCASCGTPWARILEARPEGKDWNRARDFGHSRIEAGNTFSQPAKGYSPPITLGWASSCGCGANVVPCTVFDPFMGSGTTAIVAHRTGRKFLGTEGSAQYIDIARDRIDGDRLPIVDHAIEIVEPEKVLAPTQLGFLEGV